MSGQRESFHQFLPWITCEVIPSFLEINMVGIIFKLSYVVKEKIGFKGNKGQRDLVEKMNDK
jgi:hypothetical protein